MICKCHDEFKALERVANVVDRKRPIPSVGMAGMECNSCRIGFTSMRPFEHQISLITLHCRRKPSIVFLSVISTALVQDALSRSDLFGGSGNTHHQCSRFKCSSCLCCTYLSVIGNPSKLTIQFAQRDAASAGFAQSGCGLSDIKCICNASAFLTSVQSLIVQQCNVPDQQGLLDLSSAG